MSINFDVGTFPFKPSEQFINGDGKIIRKQKSVLNLGANLLSNIDVHMKENDTEFLWLLNDLSQVWNFLSFNLHKIN